jgi:putative ABC transport system permease protein
MRALTSAYSTLVEAWAEFRVYRARVLMSIIGVAVAIMALTAVAAISAVAQQAVVEGMERSGGRPAMLSINPPYSKDGTPAPPAAFDTQVQDELKRYDIRYWSRQGYVNMSIRDLPPDANLQPMTVDPPYAAMFRTRIAEGSWFSSTDANRLVPAVVVNQGLWKVLGSPDLRTHPIVHLQNPITTDAVIIGVARGGDEHNAQVWMLADSYDALLPAGVSPQDQIPISYAAWVPEAKAEILKERLQAELTRAAGKGMRVDVNRQDYLSYQGPDPLLFVKVIGAASAGLILVLGALGLVNISMVTVRARIREIGIRRSFGATAARVFAGVMMESVVATAAAGVVGVMVAILALENPIVADFLKNQGLQDVPAFPLSAAVFGMLVAIGVGALAGVLPAIVAIRVKPIDAIRY